MARGPRLVGARWQQGHARWLVVGQLAFEGGDSGAAPSVDGPGEDRRRRIGRFDGVRGDRKLDLDFDVGLTRAVDGGEHRAVAGDDECVDAVLVGRAHGEPCSATPDAARAAEAAEGADRNARRPRVGRRLDLDRQIRRPRRVAGAVDGLEFERVSAGLELRGVETPTPLGGRPCRPGDLAGGERIGNLLIDRALAHPRQSERATAQSRFDARRADVIDRFGADGDEAAGADRDRRVAVLLRCRARHRGRGQVLVDDQRDDVVGGLRGGERVVVRDGADGARILVGPDDRRVHVDEQRQFERLARRQFERMFEVRAGEHVDPRDRIVVLDQDRESHRRAFDCRRSGRGRNDPHLWRPVGDRRERTFSRLHVAGRIARLEPVRERARRAGYRHRRPVVLRHAVVERGGPLQRQRRAVEAQVDRRDADVVGDGEHDLRRPLEHDARAGAGPREADGRRLHVGLDAQLDKRGGFLAELVGRGGGQGHDAVEARHAGANRRREKPRRLDRRDRDPGVGCGDHDRGLGHVVAGFDAKIERLTGDDDRAVARPNPRHLRRRVGDSAEDDLAGRADVAGRVACSGADTREGALTQRVGVDDMRGDEAAGGARCCREATAWRHHGQLDASAGLDGVEDHLRCSDVVFALHRDE